MVNNIAGLINFKKHEKLETSQTLSSSFKKLFNKSNDEKIQKE